MSQDRLGSPIGARLPHGTAVAVGAAMQLRIAAVALVALVAGSADAAQPVEPPPPPGAEAFLGCQKYPPEKRFKWSVRGEVGVSELAASLGQISCKPILVNSAIAQRGGKVMIDVPDLVTAGDVYRLFYRALESRGLSVVAVGGTIQIVDSGRAKEIATPELDGAAADGRADDRYVVRLIHPKHAAPQELAELLTKLKSKDGDVSVFGASALVVIDRATNARRMAELVGALDVGEGAARIFTLQTHGQTPTDLASSLEKSLSAAVHRPTAAPDAKGAPPKGTVAVVDNDVRAIVPIDAAHMIAVIGSDEGFGRVQAIAARNDPPPHDGAASPGHDIYLANPNPEDVAATLQAVGLSARSATGSGSSGGAAGASSAPRMSVPAPGGGTLPLTGDVRIGADKTSNSLVVFANASDFSTVKDLVQKLDVPRRQVYVETVILDLTVDKARTIGVSWHQTSTNSDNSVNTFVGNQSSTLVSWSPTSLAAAAAGGGVGGGLFAGVLGKSFTLFGQSIPSFGVALQALEHTKDVNIISRPHLMTMDNTKATISVGQQIVYQTGSLGALTSGSTASLLTNYARQPVALSIELTPHLNESDSIRLEINGNIEDLADGSTSPGGPTTNQRKIQTAVVVHDGETIVLGGLTKETDTQQIDKIPGLGDIPLLGRLFQTRNKERVKQELLIIMTPYIIRSHDDVRRIAEERENERREFLERYSAFADEGQFDAHVDYKRKRGLLEEVNQTAIAAELEGVALRAAEAALKPTRVDGPISFVPSN
jgi:general secretion pathway protein D